MIGMLQVFGGPGIPRGMWQDPYILGFTNQTIGAWAQFMTGGKAVGEDLGFALHDTYSAVTNMNGSAIAMLATDLAVAEDPEFIRGRDNATALFLYGQDRLKDESKNAAVLEARRSAKALAAQPSRAQINSLLVKHVWLDEVKRVAAGAPAQQR